MENNLESSQSSLTPTEDRAPDSNNTGEKKEGLVTEVFRFALLALLIVLPIRIFVAQPFIVSGASMESTFSTGQYLIVDQLTYYFEEPQRGEVIVFRYPKDPSKFFIKRIIGLPGDTIQIDGNKVTIINVFHPDGITLDEAYVLGMKPNTVLTETLGSGEYFVMGDNRDASSDSRSWGVLQRDKIIGRAFLRLFPFSAFGVLPGDVDIEGGMKL